MSNAPLQGIYIDGTFDQLINKQRKDNQGQEYKAYFVGMVVRTEESTHIYQLRTKSPETYAKMEQGMPLRVRVWPRVYKDNIYYNISE